MSGGQNRLKDRISLIQKTETPWSRWKAGRLPRSKPVAAVKPLKDKNTVGGEGRGQSGGNKGEKVEGGCRKKVVNIGYAFAKRRRHRKPRPDCNGRGRLMGLPKIDGGCTVVAWNTRTANFFPRPTTSPYTFTPLSPRSRRSPAWFFLRAFAACTPFSPFLERKSLPPNQHHQWKISIDPITSFIQGLSARKYFSLFTRGRKSFLTSAPVNESRGETSDLCSQVRDDMAADGVEPLEEEIPHEDIIGRDYCRYNVKRPIAP